MANALAPQKTMTLGEGGLALVFAALAVLSIVIAAKAYTPEYAFHAYLFTAGSIAAVFAIINRYYDRPVGAAPLTLSGSRSVQAAALTSIFLTCAGAGFGTVTLSRPFSMLALIASGLTPAGNSSERTNEP